jgi:GH25 family lysozyme M1 (1,4-beta-N-acetylmuramidase)
MIHGHGLDLSAFQHPVADWTALLKSRYRVVYHKLSQGIGGSQLELARKVGERCREAGIDFGVYHFVSKGLEHSARAEAEHFGKLAARLSELTTLPPVLDVEPRGTGNAWGDAGMTRRQLAAWCVSWAAAVGRVPVLYYPAERSFVPILVAAMPRSPRWPSSRPYRVGRDGPDVPPDEPDTSLAPQGWDVWQYSSRCGGVPGILGRCDRNVFRDIKKLRRVADMTPLP